MRNDDPLGWKVLAWFFDHIMPWIAMSLILLVLFSLVLILGMVTGLFHI